MSVRRHRILCVDGNKDTCDLVAFAIGREDYETKTALSMSEAITLATSEHFDLFIVDKTFNDGTWQDLLRVVRSRSPTSQFILYSSHPYEPTFKEAISAGADAHLVSDGNTQSLINAIRDLLRRGVED